MKKLLALFLTACALACGGPIDEEILAPETELRAVPQTPEEVAQQEADNRLMAMNPADNCGSEVHDEGAIKPPHDDVIEKAFNRPEGYGIKQAVVGGQRCFSPIDYDCLVPATKNFKVKVANDGQDQEWLDQALMARFQFATYMVQTYPNGPQWSVQLTSGSAPFQFRTGTTHADGWWGVAHRYDVIYTSSGQGGYIGKYATCLAMVYRDTVEANPTYAGASQFAQRNWLRNLYLHEMFHCMGLGHEEVNWNQLMSINYTVSGGWLSGMLLPTATEKDRMAWFSPN